MKKIIIKSAREMLSDRLLAILSIVGVLVSIFSAVFLAMSIRASELQVVVRYTGFGITNYYRDKWYYLLSFIAFIIVLLVIHYMMAFKMYRIKGKNMARVMLTLFIILVVISTTIFYNLLKIASLT